MLQSRHAASPEPPCCSSWSLHAQSHAQPPEKPPPWEGAQPRRAAPLTTARERLCTAVTAQHSQKSTSDWKNNCDLSMQWGMTEYAISKHTTSAWGLLWVQALGASQGAPVVKNPPAHAGGVETWIRSLGREDPLEEGLVTHSSALACRVHGEEPCGLQSLGQSRKRLQRLSRHTQSTWETANAKTKKTTLNSFLSRKSGRWNGPVKDVLPTPEGKWHFCHQG